jgi:ligand-binding SRPBCC domain-containing protein
MTEAPRPKWRLECEMTAPVAIERAFALFEDPYNLAKVTPAWLKFRIEKRDPIIMGRGTQIDYTIRWLELPVRWRTRITDYDPPRLFVDQQIRGPYQLWRHPHEFRETAGGTVISDRVDYRLPFGFAGDLAHALVVRRQLIGIFRFRQRAIAELLLPGGVARVSTSGPRVLRA